MNTSHDRDQQFHENLRVVGSRIPVPEGPSDEVRLHSVAEFQSGPIPRHSQRLKLLRRPAVLSTLGMAACLALMVGLLFPSNGGPTVEAATILAKLNEQIEEPGLIELTLDSIVIEEVSVNGKLHISESGVVGDIHVIVTEDADEPPLVVDLSMALSADQSWVLLRKLQIPDADVQPILTMFFPPGSETLLILPKDIDIDDLDLDLGEELRELGSVKVVEAFQELIRTQPDTDATITEQPDGTILLTFPITDARALEDLEHLVIFAARQSSDIEIDEEGVEIGDEDDELIGSTFMIVYDPATERVRSFAITDFGSVKGTISVEIHDGQVDPALFDPNRVTTPETRVFDLNALESLLEGFDFGAKTGG
ncbi:MAG: hypothetical protein WBE26_07125 [Phycisphaerae bacterium]